MNDIDLGLLFHRQAVQPPYFAFDRIWRTEKGVSGTFSPEHPMEHEGGLIAAAEAGRHLAILGACAAAATAPDNARRYYLAGSASLTRCPFWPGDSAKIEATSEVTDATNHGLTTFGTICGPQPIYTLRCSYHVLPERLFTRLFKTYYDASLPAHGQSPYRHGISLRDVTHSDNGLSAVAGPLSVEDCAGHFPCYPAWPVAVVMHTLTRVAGRALQHIVNRECRHSVVQAEVFADHLVPAASALSFRVTRQESNHAPPLYQFDCIATNDTHTIGSMQLTLELLE